VLRLGAAELRLVDTEHARAQALAEALDARSDARVTANSDPARALEGATGLIHATPTGMAKLPGLPIPAVLLRPSMWVSEIVYFPLETELLQAARSLGCPTMDGGTMAVGQAVGAFELFTGLKADAARMEQHFQRLLGSR
jgi:shikimate dehydrogenase